MEETLLQYIIEQFGETEEGERRTHYSYCRFPEDDCTCKDLQEITQDTSLIRGGYMDSFEMVTVLVFIEAKFGVIIPDKEATADNFDTVRKIVELIKRYSNEDTASTGK